MVETAPPAMASRALNYVLALPSSVQGQGGHDSAFRVAAVLCQGFAMERAEALAVMREWNHLRANPPWSDRELEHKVDSALSRPGEKPCGYLLRSSRSPGRSTSREWEGVVAAPAGTRQERLPAFNPRALAAAAAQCRRGITLDWLADRSPVAVPPVVDQIADGRATARLFIETLFQPGERLLIFTRFYSQGDFMVEAGGASWRLAEKPGVPAAPSPVPSGGREDLWFLTAPVSGQWVKTTDAEARLSRRCEGAIERWPFILLESDHAEESLWLRALATLPLPIAALYTSGGKSVHALVRIDCSGKAEFDSVRDILRAVLCPLGADGAAMTAVRLSRLPGCLRHGSRRGEDYLRYDQPRLQRLVYLNPSAAPGVALLDLLK